MVDLKRRVEAEIENILRAQKDLKAVLLVEKKTNIELAAIATFLLNIYNGMENILKQVLKSRGVKIRSVGACSNVFLNKAYEQARTLHLR